MANIITSCRILCGLWILFVPAFSKEFYLLCLIGAASDICDGIVARKFNKTTLTGVKLDTIADTVFVLSMLIKVITAINLPIWLIVWTAIIAVIKIINIASSFILFKRFIAEHTTANKITGVLLFVALFCMGFLPTSVLHILAIITCIIATFAAVQERHYIRCGKEIN